MLKRAVADLLPARARCGGPSRASARRSRSGSAAPLGDAAGAAARAVGDPRARRGSTATRSRDLLATCTAPGRAERSFQLWNVLNLGALVRPLDRRAGAGRRMRLRVLAGYRTSQLAGRAVGRLQRRRPAPLELPQAAPELDDEAVRRLGGIALADLRDDEKADPAAPVLVAGVEVDPERPWQPAPGATGLSAFTLHYHAWLVPLAAGGRGGAAAGVVGALRLARGLPANARRARPRVAPVRRLDPRPRVERPAGRGAAARPLARAGAGPVAGARARRGPPGARRGGQPPAAQRDRARGRRGALRRRGRAHAPARSGAARAAPAAGPVPARRQPRRALDGVPGGGRQRPPGRVRSEP